MSAEELAKKKASEVNLIEEYNNLLKEIPWENLQILPQKLAKVGNLLPGFSFDPKDVDVISPIKRVVTYLGILVKRLRSAEKQADKFEARLAELEGKQQQ